MLTFTINQQFALKEVAIQIIGQEQQLQTNNQWYGLKANADSQKLWLNENSFVLLGTASGAQLVKWLFMRGFQNLDEIFQAYFANKQAKLEARKARSERIAAWWTTQTTPEEVATPAPELTPEEVATPAPELTPEEVATPAPEEAPVVIPEEEPVVIPPKSTPKGKKGQRKPKKG